MAGIVQNLPFLLKSKTKLVFSKEGGGDDPRLHVFFVVWHGALLLTVECGTSLVLCTHIFVSSNCKKKQKKTC